MAFVLTYQSLTTAVENYLERNDKNLVDQIPLFIMLGERRIARDLKILGLKISITGDLTPGPNGEVFAKPTRWLNDSSFNIGVGPNLNSRQYLLQRSVEFCRMYWPDPSQTGTPKYYSSDYDYNFWLVVPTPDIAYPYEIIYYETPPLIDDVTNINFLTESAPEVLLYATLLEALIYANNNDRIPTLQAKYDSARQALGDEDIRRIQDAFSKRGG